MDDVAYSATCRVGVARDHLPAGHDVGVPMRPASRRPRAVLFHCDELAMHEELCRGGIAEPAREPAAGADADALRLEKEGLFVSPIAEIEERVGRRHAPNID